MTTLMIPTIGRITGKTFEADDVITIAISDHGLSDFLPGQFNMIGIRGLGEAPISCSGSDGDSVYHTIKVVGNVTRALAGSDVGDQVTIRGPYGQPWPISNVDDGLIFIVGGIGIAAVRAAVDFIAKNRSDFKNVYLLYGVHHPRDFIFLEDIRFWSEKEISVERIVDITPIGTDWQGRIGLVTELIDTVEADFTKTTSMICGPEIMMRFVSKTMLERGHDPQKLYLSLERRMRCGVGQCGHCIIGDFYVCKDGPIFSYSSLSSCADVL